MRIAVALVFDAVNVRPDVGQLHFRVVTRRLALFHAFGAQAILQRIWGRDPVDARLGADGRIVDHRLAAGLGVIKQRIMRRHQLAARIGQRVPHNPMAKVQSLVQKRRVMDGPLWQIEYQQAATRFERLRHAVQPGVAPLAVMLLGQRVVPVPVAFPQVVRRIGKREIKHPLGMQLLHAL